MCVPVVVVVVVLVVGVVEVVRLVGVVWVLVVVVGLLGDVSWLMSWPGAEWAWGGVWSPQALNHANEFWHIMCMETYGKRHVFFYVLKRYRMITCFNT